MVMGGDSRSKVRGFESLCQILDGQKISCKRLIKIEISEKKVFKVVKRFRATFDHMM